MSPLEVVDQFRQAWLVGDLEKVCSLVTDDIFYHNMPRPSMSGLDAFRTYMLGYEERFGRFLSVNWEIKNIVGGGSVVFIERVSHITFANGRKIDCPIVGVFEVRDGKISSWKDYFDKATFDA